MILASFGQARKVAAILLGFSTARIQHIIRARSPCPYVSCAVNRTSESASIMPESCVEL